MSGELIFAIVILSIITLLLGFLFFKTFKQYKGNFLQGHTFLEIFSVLLLIMIVTYIRKNLIELDIGEKNNYILMIVLIIALIGFIYICYKILFKLYISINNHFLYKKLERMSNIYKNGGLNKKEFEIIRDEIKSKIK